MSRCTGCEDGCRHGGPYRFVPSAHLDFDIGAYIGGAYGIGGPTERDETTGAARVAYTPFGALFDSWDAYLDFIGDRDGHKTRRHG